MFFDHTKHTPYLSGTFIYTGKFHEEYRLLTNYIELENVTRINIIEGILKFHGCKYIDLFFEELLNCILIKYPGSCPFVFVKAIYVLTENVKLRGKTNWRSFDEYIGFFKKKFPQLSGCCEIWHFRDGSMTHHPPILRLFSLDELLQFKDLSSMGWFVNWLNAGQFDSTIFCEFVEQKEFLEKYKRTHLELFLKYHQVICQHPTNIPIVYIDFLISDQKWVNNKCNRNARISLQKLYRAVIQNICGQFPNMYADVSLVIAEHCLANVFMILY